MTDDEKRRWECVQQHAIVTSLLNIARAENNTLINPAVQERESATVSNNRLKNPGISGH